MAGKLDEVLVSSAKLLEILAGTTDGEEEEKLVAEYIRTLNNHVRLEDFKNNLEWFNTSKSLSLYGDLKGKVVVLDFFTYCCINCLHILPYLKTLEDTCSVKDGLVIVGVHSAKFNNEKDSANILSALQRYEVHHPVVNDSEGIMWNDIAIPCWPTLLVLGPSGEPILVQVGESGVAVALKFVKIALKYFREKGYLSEHTLPVTPAAHLRPKCNNSLLFPGKITVCHCCKEKPCGTIAISDTGNHRVVIMSDCGKVESVIGGTEKGCSDGTFTEARFNGPQGLAFQSCKLLFVADTENHCIRKIDLTACQVTTVAGTGKQGHDTAGGGLWTQQSLSSPWDLCLVPGREADAQNDLSVLLIAMAGTHQLWALFLRDAVWWKQRFYKEGTCVAIVGTGKEENRNNLYPHAAAFAQPSGVTLSPELQAVFVADSESSSIRRVSLVDGKVSAVAGGSRSPFDLFQFGDVDGKLYDAKLQHPLGVAWCPRNETLYVADSYNHKIKAISISTNFCKTFAGSGKSGDSVGPIGGNSVQFSEPGGLCVSSDASKIYIADTNNHSIKVIHLELELLERVDVHISNMYKKKTRAPRNCVQTKIAKIHPNGGMAKLKFIVGLDEGLSLTPDAPQKWALEFPDEEWQSNNLSGEYKKELDVELTVPKAKENQSTSAVMVFRLYLCRANNECLMKNLQFLCTVHYDTAAPTVISDSFKYIVS
ncbi:NHL repeat-containing protein 2 [Schistocerca cancellata]|uniref:NHL repeat-containing protein 2 n=1 Tax=Schistocerca cancellata TaxID=274614 RepID=UPI002118AC21|nr:NHL repeat-containing protein 2 [Schistocerca cancellata]